MTRQGFVTLITRSSNGQVLIIDH